jgi:hypothetical protein
MTTQTHNPFSSLSCTTEFGIPLNWQHAPMLIRDHKLLEWAIRAFLKNEPLEQGGLEILLNYCRYYFNAPCWEGEAELEELKAGISKTTTIEDLRICILNAIELGIDPL